jgi:hypothetical protein
VWIAVVVTGADAAGEETAEEREEEGGSGKANPWTVSPPGCGGGGAAKAERPGLDMPGSGAGIEAALTDDGGAGGTPNAALFPEEGGAGGTPSAAAMAGAAGRSPGSESCAEVAEGRWKKASASRGSFSAGGWLWLRVAIRFKASE